MQELLERAKNLAKHEPDEAMRILNDIMDEDMEGQWGQMALFMSGYIMMEAERYGLAYHIYNRCAQLNPGISEIYSNMGMCLEEYDIYKAKRMFQKAYQIKPDNANAYANEALICLQTGEPQKCIDLSKKAMELDPSMVAPKHNTALAQIMLRDWTNGWKNYYETLGVKHRERRDYGLPEWDGKSEGEVVIYGEQGVGDEIMFASCLQDVPNDIILDCDSRLEGLFKRSFPEAKVYGTRFSKETPLLDENKPKYQCAIGQLPHFYRHSEQDFPKNPYLKVDSERELQWRALFDTFKGRKIGVAWNGGLPNTGMKRRSLKPEDLEPIFNDKDTFISLEYKAVPTDVLDRYNIKSYPRATAKGGDIDDLAALISQLDMVVTSCTTVVYIAGALGIPCYVLVPREPGYRYHLKGDFPWYESVKLFRQKGSWKDLTTEVNKCLESL